MRRASIPLASGAVSAAFAFAFARSARLGGHPPTSLAAIVSVVGAAVLGATAVLPSLVERIARRYVEFWSLPRIVWPVVSIAVGFTIALVWDFVVLAVAA